MQRSIEENIQEHFDASNRNVKLPRLIMPFPKCLMYNTYVKEFKEKGNEDDIICEKTFLSIFPFKVSYG